LAAWLFLKWVTAPEQQARWVRAFGDLSVRSSTAGLLQDYIAESPGYDVALSFLDGKVAAEPGVVGYGECREAMREMLSAIANRGEPAPWLSDTAQICDASLE
jgi:ABC-type glycerol-3-phosphate transport system substrate-binding protein